MQIIDRIETLRGAVTELRQSGNNLALVPTMGALHAGHMRLVEEARVRADRVAVSIFVNPAQFGAGEDLDAYPRRLEEDAAKLRAAGVDLLWAPPEGEVYGPGFATTIRVEGVGEGLCGGSRRGHFDGVALVVAKLFNQVRPDIAFFGEKDYQQLAVIRRMARDLDFGIEILGLPTVRAADGLALSSRNAYLSKQDRARATTLPEALRTAGAAIANGAEVEEALAEARSAMLGGGFDSIDYLELRDGESLERLNSNDSRGRLFVAARIGGTRLIDNIALFPNLTTDKNPHDG